MTDAERWQSVCQRAGFALGGWMQKHPYIAQMLPVLGMIVDVMKEASLTKIEQLLDNLEEATGL
jgi:hypothetical protein